MTHTPAMQQYYDMKQEYSDSILFFRMWDFYEMFDNDAEIAHKVLGINITTRNKNADTPTPLAGIPYHALDKYLPILIKAGYKVAISEQVSDPKLKWIVKREVVRVVTPATLSLEWWDYKEDEWNFIAAIVHKDDSYAISYLEVQSNKWETGQCRSFSDFSNQLYKIYPKEIIVSKKLFENKELRELLSKKFSLNIYYFDVPSWTEKILQSHFSTKNLSWFWIHNKPLCIDASALLLEYMKNNQKSQLKHLDSLSYKSFDWFLELDESTIKNLDLIYNYATNSRTEGTLLWVIDKTKTSMWKRQLQHNLIHPLLEKTDIEKRQLMIERFLSNPLLLEKVQEKLKYIADIEAIMTRLSLWRAYPKDLLNLKRSLQLLLEVFDLIHESKDSKLIQLLDI